MVMVSLVASATKGSVRVAHRSVMACLGRRPLEAPLTVTCIVLGLSLGLYSLRALNVSK